MKNKKLVESRDVTVILSDSIMKNVKGWELTNKSNKVVVKSFRQATTSQMKWHVKEYGIRSKKYYFALQY